MKDFEVVFERPHPGSHLFLFRAGEEPDVLAHAHRGAGHDDFAEAPFVNRLRERGGKRHESLARARLTENRDEVDLRIHEEIDRHVLLAVSRVDAPDAGAALRAVVLHQAEGDLLAMNRRDEPHEVFVAVDPEAFVHDEARRVVGFKFVEGGAVILPGAERRRSLVPESGLEHELSGVEHVGVVEHLVGEVVLCRNPEGGRLDAHVDVLRHQHDGALGEGFAHAFDGCENPVVALRKVEFSGEVLVKGLRFEPEAALRFGVAEKRERNPGIDFAVVRFNQGVERAAHRTGVPRDVGKALLVVVELLERRHRKEDVVLGKAEERERVVHEHVGVENKEPRLTVGHARAALSSLKRPLNAGGRRAAARKGGGILLRAGGLSLRLRFCFRGLGGERLR